MSVLAHAYDFSRTTLTIAYADSDGDWSNHFQANRSLEDRFCRYTWFAIGY